MTMTLDTTQQRFGGPAMNFDYPSHGQPPAFSNPWSSSSPPHSGPPPGAGLFVGSQQQQQQPPMSHSMMAGKGPNPRGSSGSASSSMPSYGSMPVPASSAGWYPPMSPRLEQIRLTYVASHKDLLSINRMQTSSAAYADPSYTTSASPVNGQFAPSSAAPYDTMGYAPAPVRQPGFALAPDADSARRFSQS